MSGFNDTEGERLSRSHSEGANDLIESLNDTGKMVGRLLLALISIGVLATLLLGYPDSHLLITTQTVSVPFAGPASFKTALVLLPIMMIGLRLVLERYLRHWHQLENERATREIPPPTTISPLRDAFLKPFVWLVVYPLMPASITLLAYVAAVFWEWATVLAGVCVAATIALLPIPLKRKLGVVVVSVAGSMVVIETNWGLDATFHRPFQLELANLERAVLSGVDFRDADMVNANLTRANLTEANLRGAVLTEANLTNARLSNANATELARSLVLLSTEVATPFQESTPSKLASAMEVLASEMQKTGAADLTRAYLHRANLTAASLSHADLTGAFLSGANLTRAELWMAVLVDANLSGTDLSEAYLTGADFSGADMSHADLTKAFLYKAVLARVNLSDADLTGALLSGADLRTAIVDQKQLNEACGDGETKLPPDLTIPECQSVR